MVRGRPVGFRFPCRICGASRAMEPRNGDNAAVCRRCYQTHVRRRNGRNHLSIYLGHELKAAVLEASKNVGVNPSEFVRQILYELLMS